MKKYFFLFLLSLATLSAIEDERAITLKLEQWSQDFNAKKIQPSCDLFARDLVASYPGIKDRNYDQICSQMKSIFLQKEETYHYDKPEILHIYVNGNFAVVRLIWTLTISSKEGEEKIREKGIDLFTKQKDGSWKITVSHAFPIE